MTDPTATAQSAGQDRVTDSAATALAAEAQRRFHTDPVFHARCFVVDGIVAEDVRSRGVPLTDPQRFAARHAAAIALLLAEGGFHEFGV